MNMDDMYGAMIAKLQEIAARRINDYRMSAWVFPRQGLELAGSQGGQLPGPEAARAMRGWAARQNAGGAVRDWLHEGGMMQQRMQYPQPVPARGRHPESAREIPAGSTPLSRLSDRIEEMGLVETGAFSGGNAALPADNPGRRVSYDDPRLVRFRMAAGYGDGDGFYG